MLINLPISEVMNGIRETVRIPYILKILRATEPVEPVILVIYFASQSKIY